ncbi:MAG: AAA family ATPase [Planctomycetes bacterium]|nr:AAA family ATPase [Planctomycetota bacterium]
MHRNRRARKAQIAACRRRELRDSSQEAPATEPAAPHLACSLGLLSRLGLYGLESIELPLVAGLVLGEPILLVGGHGSGKTTLCRAVAGALGLSFWAYDASKSLFEDVIGFPNPQQLGKGVLDYVPTVLSIWGRESVLIDELSRGTPAMQSKWLEVVRSRRIMGVPLDDLRQVFAAMNPPSYLGAFPLDEALAGRFTVVIQVPSARELSDDALRAVIQNVTEDDCVGLSEKGQRAEVEVDSALLSFVAGARRRYRRAPSGLRDQTVEYVLGLTRMLADREVFLDSRRLGMLQRLLLGALAVDAQARGRRRPFVACRELLWQTLQGGLPFAACAEDVSEALLRSAHERALARVLGEQSGSFHWLPIDPLLRARALIGSRNLSPAQRSAGLTRCLESAGEGEPDAREAGARGLAVLAHALGEGDLEFPPDDTFRLLDSLQRSLAVAPAEHAAALASLRGVFEERWRQGAFAKRLPTALRLGLGALSEGEHDYVDPDELATRVQNTASKEEGSL